MHICIDSLVKASDLIKSKKTTVDSQLFLIKHLLILKEQIVAFDIEFGRPEVDIDFSSVTGTFWEIREKGSLFNPNGLLKLMTKGLPKVVENMLDAKVVCTWYRMDNRGFSYSSFYSRLQTVKMMLNPC